MAEAKRLTLQEGVEALLKRGRHDVRRAVRSGIGDGATLARYILNPTSAATDLISIYELQHYVRAKAEAAAKAEAKAQDLNPETVRAIDNQWDAQRHAEFSSALARLYGPTYARLMMEAWELNPKARDTPEAHAMDRYNNAVAIDSAMSGRPYTLDDLQLSPATPAVRPWRR